MMLTLNILRLGVFCRCINRINLPVASYFRNIPTVTWMAPIYDDGPYDPNINFSPPIIITNYKLPP